MSNAWIARQRPAKPGAVPLVCIAHAGGGAATFRGWGDELPDTVDLIALRLPGRESRLREEPLRKMDALVPAIQAGCADLLAQPCALFGYCSGALVAFELARALQRAGRPPCHLFVCACPAPAHVVRDSAVHRLTGGALTEHLRALGIMPPTVLDDPDLMALFEPAVRADYEVFETAPYHTASALDLPITVFGGDLDPSTSVPTLLEWRAETSMDFLLRLYRGDHSFFQTNRRSMIGTVAHELAAVARPGSWR